MPTTSRTRRAVLVAVACLGLGAGLVAAGTGTAAAAPSRPVTTAAADVCATGTTQARSSGRRDDTGELSSRQVRSFERDLQRRAGADGQARRARPSTAALRKKLVRIPVRVHVIKPRSGARTPMTKKKVKRQISILNKGFAGRQSGASANARFRFVLKGIDYTANRDWYDADYRTRAAKQMQRTLHRGDLGTLNLYFSSPKGTVAETLGWSSFPAAAARSPKTDGVVINVGTVPGGGIKRYNKGDTTVHEVGHWLGLYHTFQGGCSARNDQVGDTPAEATPSFSCPTGRDTCTAPGKDPIHNFMNYSYDSCMNQFTRGQADRMKIVWWAYRR